MKGNRILLAAMGGLTALAIATPALAVMSVPNGWYLEGNLGSTKLTNKNYNGSASTSGLGYSGNLGYKFMPFFAAEAGYTRYKDTTIKDMTSTTAATDTHYSYDLAFKGILPAADTGFEVFAKVGAERTSSHVSISNPTAANNIGLTSGSHTTTGLLYGGGAQYYFMPELAAVVQWERAHGNSSTGTLDLISGGISFTFD